jgi:Golgi nucleoside diphosphatase
VDVAARKAEVLSAMSSLGVASTASEIHAWLRDHGSLMDIGSVRSRLNQLRVDDGKVRPMGSKVTPRPVGSGRPEQTWQVVA